LGVVALAQHHGLPTRLLDWTYGALAAMWFAVDSGGKDATGTSRDAAVWLLKTHVDDFVKIEQQASISPLDNRKDENL